MKFLSHFQPTPTKGGPRSLFCEYSEHVRREPRNSSFLSTVGRDVQLLRLMNLLNTSPIFSKPNL